MAEQQSTTQRLREEARRAATKYTDINAACPYPWGSAEAVEFKREFMAARADIEAGDVDLESDADEHLLCNCAGDGFTVQELETGKCQACGKAVVV